MSSELYKPDGTVNRNPNGSIQQYLPLVKRIANQTAGKLPSSVHVDDLIQAGSMGLMDALLNYDASQGASFETYAAQRIRGAILDELRAMDWAPRSIRKNMRDIERMVHTLEHKLGRPATETEMADEMKMDLNSFHQMLFEAKGHQLVYLEDLSGDEDGGNFLDRYRGNEENPLDILASDKFRKDMILAIEKLPEKEKLLMGLYYEQDLNLKEIGTVMGISESRVSQIHTQIVVRLRAGLKNWIGHGSNPL